MTDGSPAVLQRAFEESRRSDLFIVIGSTLVVEPAASMPRAAVEASARLVIINLSDTPLDRIVDIRMRGKAGEVLPPIVDAAS